MNYDTIYTKEYERVYLELSCKVITALKNPTKNTLLFKRDLLINEFNDLFKEMTTKKIGPSAYMPDKFTERLLNDFKHHVNDYVEDKITNFIDDHLEKIKAVFKDVELSIPKNINLNAQQTAEFIAKHDALKKFIDKLYSVERSDTIEICAEKISIEGYTPPEITGSISTETYLSEPEDSELTKALKKEYTTARQILAIKYLVKSINKDVTYDNTKLAEFVRFLTGKELGAKAIKNTNIYKRINKVFNNDYPEKVEDLEYIKKYFDDLNLNQITIELDKEINSSTKTVKVSGGLSGYPTDKE